MGLPGHHRTSSDKRKRSAHFGIKAQYPTVCAKCKKPVMPHRACGFCGFYQGREVVKMSAMPKAAPATKAPKAPKAEKPAKKVAKKEAAPKK